MKKIALIALALAISAGSAFAADLPSRKALVLPPPPPPPMWTGFYAGLNAGGTWANSNTVSNSTYPLYLYPDYADYSWGIAASLPASSRGGNSSGFIGGGQIGYNWQVPLGGYSFVTGIEADIQGIAGSNGNAANANGLNQILNDGDGPYTYLTSQQVARNVQYLGTVRGRLGFLALPTLLLYGTGGLAYGGVSLNTTSFTVLSYDGEAYAPGIGTSNYANAQVGWTAGGGVEWMLLPNWSLKAEYLYYDLGRVVTSSVASGTYTDNTLQYAQVTSSSTRFNGNIVRAGVNYHFNWGAAPVVAKY